MESDTNLNNRFYKTIKVPLKHVLRNPKVNQEKITTTVIKAHKIVIHALQFLKLYLLDYYETNNSLPVIDKTLINLCMKIQCNESTRGKKPSEKTQELKNNLKEFHKKHYSNLMQDEELDYICMNTVLDYLTIDILTKYENNIKQHYVEYVERYVNVYWQKNRLLNIIRKKVKNLEQRNKALNKLCLTLRHIKNDILNVKDDKYKSHKSYHNWINKQKKQILPIKKFQKNNIKYDLQCSPQDYLPCMINMMKKVEEQEYFINNVFPLRSAIIPKHICIDTTSVVQLLLTKKFGKKGELITKGNLKKRQNEIWEFFFRTKKDCFQKKKNYTFHHMIKTDGISCSILLIRNDKIGRKIRQPKIQSSEVYITDIKESLKDKKIVGIDPGKNDLIYCVDGVEKEANKFRYSQAQRNNETKKHKFLSIFLEHKQEKIDGKTIIEYETELSEYNKKSLNINKYKAYLKKKNEINHKLFPFYEKELYRKLKLHTYMNTLKSEQLMMKRFRRKFGDSNNTIVCIGDYEQKQHMKFKEPTKGVGMRKIFRQYGYKVYLVNEFRTSCQCCDCETENSKCEKFLKRQISRSESEEIRTIHGLLKCTTCSGVWNRDCNGAKNIYKIAKCAVEGKDRPLYLSRKRKTST